jgi:hypothetical protein
MITPYHGKLENDMLNFEAELPFISVLTLIKKKLACSKSCLPSALTFRFPQQIILPLTC